MPPMPSPAAQAARKLADKQLELPASELVAAVDEAHARTLACVADLRDRTAALAYLARVRDAVVERLARAEPGTVETYLHLLTLVHSDMQVEGFTYMRQTLGYPAPPLPGA